VFALAVGASRVYLGDHYPADVLGSYLTVAAAALLVSAFTDLPRIRRLATRLLRAPEIAAARAQGAPGMPPETTQAGENRRAQPGPLEPGALKADPDRHRYRSRDHASLRAHPRRR
jgi:hypothetical protein